MNLTTRRWILASMAIVIGLLGPLALGAAPAAAGGPVPDPPDPLPAPAENGIYPIIFPVIGDNYYSDTWGACRDGCSRGHIGVDIMTYGKKGLPVVAAASGTVGWVSSSCCAMQLLHDDGWQSWYIHLNNDTQNPDGSYSDDGKGWGFAPGIEPGAHVEAGQLIGWVGDSGNAERVAPQLHFEIWASGTPINPTPHVDAALRLTEPGVVNTDPACPEGAVCDVPVFVDTGSRWYTRDELRWGATVDAFYFGYPGDVPMMGDWDCDGVATPGLYRQSDGYVYLRNSNTQGVADVKFFFGDPGDVPLAGDFDGDGCDTVSIFRPSEGRVFVINELGANDGGLGAAEFDFFFGNPGDVPFVGDFDGDGVDSVGLYRRSTGFVYFRDALSSGVADREFFYGDPGDVIVAGDWDGDGDDTVAVYRPSTGSVYVNFDNAPGIADHTIWVGSFIDAVVAGGAA